jgi:hypothetical protein
MYILVYLSNIISYYIYFFHFISFPVYLSFLHRYFSSVIYISLHLHLYSEVSRSPLILSSLYLSSQPVACLQCSCLLPRIRLLDRRFPPIWGLSYRQKHCSLGEMLLKIYVNSLVYSVLLATLHMLDWTHAPTPHLRIM